MIIIGINIKDYKNNYLIIGLALIACLSTVRCNFLLSNIYSYSRFLIIIPLTVILIYLFRKVIKIKQIRLYTACILIIFSIFIATIRWQIFFAKIDIPLYTQNLGTYIPLHTQNLGTLYEKFNKAVAINTLTNWINRNTNISDTVLIVPEGIYFNFITGRKTNLKYYHLIPNHIAALGEKNIINDLQQNKPDYFILNLQEYSEYGEDVICVNFGQGICKFIRANYNLKENIASADNELMFTIYSLKDTNKKSK